MKFSTFLLLASLAMYFIYLYMSFTKKTVRDVVDETNNEIEVIPTIDPIDTDKAKLLVDSNSL